MSKAYTLIEVIIVIGILAIITGLSSLSVVSFGQKGDVDSAKTIVIVALKESQANSLAELDDKTWGVHLENSRVVIYASNGSGYVPNASGNIARVLPAKTTLTWALSGGGDNIEFSKRIGQAADAGTLTLAGAGAATSAVVINSEGMIE